MTNVSTQDRLMDLVLQKMVGFDDFLFSSTNKENFPYYNIVRENDNTTRIEIALAGYSKDEIDVFVENNILNVSYTKTEKPTSEIYIHNGIAKRKFKKTFALSESITVKSASFINGLLVVVLEEKVEEPKKINVTVN